MLRRTLTPNATRCTGVYDHMCSGKAELYKAMQSSTVFFQEPATDGYTVHHFPNSFDRRASFCCFFLKASLASLGTGVPLGEPHLNVAPVALVFI